MAQIFYQESAHNAGDLGSIPGLERSPGEGKGYLLQYSGLENSMDSIVHGVAKSRTRPRDFHSQGREELAHLLEVIFSKLLEALLSFAPYTDPAEGVCYRIRHLYYPE